jgi:hypothetical protein
MLSFYFLRKTMSHFSYTAMLSPCVWPHLPFFPEAAIEAGFLLDF